MANFVTSPNMNLSIPAVGIDPGPEWATDLNNSLTLIDQHNHTSGYGVQIPPAGLNINSDLTFQSNNAIALRSVRFTPQTAILTGALDLGCLYEVTNDLYYNDGAGNNVRITQSGNVAGTPGSIANLAPPASASYVSANSTFVFQSNTNTAGNIDVASINLRNLVANSPAVTLSPPVGLVTSYEVTLPLLPSQTSLVTIDPSGSMGTWQIDGTTLVVNSGVLEVGTVSNANIGAGSITTSEIANGAVTTAKLAPLNFFSTGPITASATTTGLAFVPGATISITTQGRPVRIFSQATTTTTSSYSRFSANGGQSQIGIFRSDISAFVMTASLGDNAISQDYSPSSLDFTDFPPAGTYIYTIYYGAFAGSASINAISFNAYEIG